jgi:hypothetical protein
MYERVLLIFISIYIKGLLINLITVGQVVKKLDQVP